MSFSFALLPDPTTISHIFGVLEFALFHSTLLACFALVLFRLVRNEWRRK
jgi:hypothetical protein